MAIVQTKLEIPINGDRTLNVILEDNARRVKFSVKEQASESYQMREEWYLTLQASLDLAKFLAGITDLKFDLSDVE